MIETNDKGEKMGDKTRTPKTVAIPSWRRKISLFHRWIMFVFMMALFIYANFISNFGIRGAIRKSQTYIPHPGHISGDPIIGIPFFLFFEVIGLFAILKTKNYDDMKGTIAFLVIVMIIFGLISVF